MDLTYSPEQIMLRDNAFRFLDEKYTAERREAALSSATGHDAAIWREFADLGWLGLPFLEDDGGFGGGHVEAAILMEAFGRSLVAEPWLAAVILAGQIIARFAGPDHKQALLPPLIGGGSYSVLAHIERDAGYRLTHVSSRAKRVKGGYVLQGRKTHVLGALGAQSYLVTARLSGGADDDTGIAVFLVPRGAPQLTISPYRLMDRTPTARLTLDNVRVSAADLVVENLTAEMLDQLFDTANAALAADAVGAMNALLAATINYTKERQQFGKPLSQFQALRHRISEMAIKCEEARAAALLATLSLSGPASFRARCVSGAKAKIGRISRQVAQEAIQLQGAMGISMEMPVGHWFKRLFVFENTFGSTAYHLQRYRDAIVAPGTSGRGLLQALEAT